MSEMTRNEIEQMIITKIDDLYADLEKEKAETFDPERKAFKSVIFDMFNIPSPFMFEHLMQLKEMNKIHGFTFEMIGKTFTLTVYLINQ